MDRPPTADRHAAPTTNVMALTLQYRVAGPMTHATGVGCSPVPLARLRDLVDSLYAFNPDLPDRQPLPKARSFNAIPGSSPTPGTLRLDWDVLSAGTAKGRAQAVLEGF